MIVLIDNYDSFCYNLYQYIGELYPNMLVFRNHVRSLEDFLGMDLTALVTLSGLS